MLSDLSSKERLQLMKFVCSFAWADLEVRPEERVFISQMIRGLDLSRDEEMLVHGWLDVPPAPDSVDPTSIPVAHRGFFLEAIEGLIRSDGQVSPDEAENFELLRQLMG
jgi:hypothetical protein